MRQQVVPVEQAEETRLHLPDDAGHAGVEIAEDEQYAVRCVLEHGSGVFRILQRAEPVDLLFDRPLEQLDLEGDPARFSGDVLVARVAHAGDFDRCVVGRLLVADGVGVVLEFEPLPRVGVHQISLDGLLIPGHCLHLGDLEDRLAQLSGPVEFLPHAAGNAVAGERPHLVATFHVGQTAGDARLPLLGDAVIGECWIQQVRRERRVTVSHDPSAKRLCDLHVSGYVTREREGRQGALPSGHEKRSRAVRAAPAVSNLYR